MSVDATIATWKLKTITAIQKLLLLSLADRAGEGGECWPSIKRLQDDTSLNRKTIIENRQILINLGLIVYTGEFKGKQNQIPVMRLTYVEHREGVVEESTSTENGTGPENNTGTSTENGTGNQYRKRDTEPKRLEPKKEPKRYIVSFPDFWTLYPSKKAKKKCQEIWSRKKLDSQGETILEKLKFQVEHDSQWQNGFIPNPATYLNQERWDDELSVTQHDIAKKELESKKLKTQKRIDEQERLTQKNLEYDREKQRCMKEDGAVYRNILKKVQLSDVAKSSLEQMKHHVAAKRTV